MTDIIDLIDQVTAQPDAHCWGCGRVLRGATEDGFCSELCQDSWHAKRRTQPARSAGPGAFERDAAAFKASLRYSSPPPTPRRVPTWSCEADGHLWQQNEDGRRPLKCASCGHTLIPWHRRARTRLLTKWNWWRGNALRRYYRARRFVSHRRPL